MYNDLFSIGPFTVHGYGLMIAIGVLAALFIAEARAKKRDMNADVLYPLTLVCVVFGFASAKVLFCIVEWRQFIKNPLQLLTGNGFVVYGGIIGGVLAAFLYCRLKKLNFWDYFDIVLPSVAVAQGFGRIRTPPSSRTTSTIRQLHRGRTTPSSSRTQVSTWSRRALSAFSGGQPMYRRTSSVFSWVMVMGMGTPPWAPPYLPLWGRWHDRRP